MSGPDNIGVSEYRTYTDYVENPGSRCIDQRL